MKAIYIIYNAAIESMVQQCMRDCGLESYTKFPLLHGSGESAGPRLGTHVWPGINRGLFIVTEEKNIPLMLEKIEALKKEHKKEGVKAFVFPVEKVI